MSVLFTPAQEGRNAEITRGIVADILHGTDARIRDAIASALDEQPPAPKYQGEAPQTGSAVNLLPGEVMVARPISDAPCHD